MRTGRELLMLGIEVSEECLWRIPQGFRIKAQRLESSATLGNRRPDTPNPNVGWSDASISHSQFR